MDELRSLKNANISNKTIFYFAPYDIATKEINGEYVVTDSSRIEATIPTLKHLVENNCKVAAISYVKRPENGYEPALSTKAHASKLSELMGKKITHVEECIGEKVSKAISEMKNGEIIMLENTRFHKEDYEENVEFAEKLTDGFDLIVFDGFPQSHRNFSSTTGILKLLPSCAGFYFESEYYGLKNLLNNPKRPFTLVIGGAKISDKVEAINNLQQYADTILLGGGPANILIKSKGKNIQNSISEEIEIDENILDKIVTIRDVVIGENPNSTQPQIIDLATEHIPPNSSIFDIGPQTIQTYTELISRSKTVFWVGPIGLFENENFANGTKAVVKSVTENNDDTIVAGGDTVTALDKFGDPKKIKHISLAGGATLEFLSGKTLEVIELLKS